MGQPLCLNYMQTNGCFDKGVTTWVSSACLIWHSFTDAKNRLTRLARPASDADQLQLRILKKIYLSINDI